MASNPSVVTCTADTWVKVADSVQTCIIHKTEFAPAKYLQTYRLEDDTAPSNDNDAVIFDKLSLVVNVDEAIDVYIKAVGVAGEVRLDS